MVHLKCGLLLFWLYGIFNIFEWCGKLVRKQGTLFCHSQKIRPDFICALQQAELKLATVLFSYMEPQGEALRSRQSGLNWLASRGQDIDLRSSLSLVKQCCHSSAHTNPQKRYKKPGSLCLCVWAIELQKEKWKHKWGVCTSFMCEKSTGSVRSFVCSLYASLLLWMLVRATGADSLRVEVCDSAAVMDRAGLKAMPNGLRSVQKLVTLVFLWKHPQFCYSLFAWRVE